MLGSHASPREPLPTEARPRGSGSSASTRTSDRALARMPPTRQPRRTGPPKMAEDAVSSPNSVAIAVALTWAGTTSESMGWFTAPPHQLASIPKKQKQSAYAAMLEDFMGTTRKTTAEASTLPPTDTSATHTRPESG